MADRKATGSPDPRGQAGPGWTFLTNHGHVLVCITRDPDVRGRDIAAQVGITERATQAIIADLIAAGYVHRTRVGRRNRYTINPDLPVRHPVEQPHRVGDLLDAMAGPHPAPQPRADNDAGHPVAG
jgi:Winged helix-turn-helix DNA-binding